MSVDLFPLRKIITIRNWPRVDIVSIVQTDLSESQQLISRPSRQLVAFSLD